MTKKQLMAAGRAKDRADRAERRARATKLAKAMASIDFYPWELEEVSRLIHGAYGRMKLAK